MSIRNEVATFEKWHIDLIHFTYENMLDEYIRLIPGNFCTMHTTNHNHYLLATEYTIEWYTRRKANIENVGLDYNKVNIIMQGSSVSLDITLWGWFYPTWTFQKENKKMNA